MKWLKSYRMFTTRPIRIFSFLLLPAALLILQLVTAVTVDGSSIAVAACILAAAGIYADQWIFGGSCSKEADRLDFLRTSARGRKVMGDALKGDCLCRLLLCTAVFGGGELIEAACAALSPMRGYNLSRGVFCFAEMVLITYTVTTLFLIIVRYFVAVSWSLCAAWLSIFLTVLLFRLHSSFPWTTVFTAVLGVLFSVAAVRNVLRKMDENCYDNRYDNGG